jgi:hypothetical protein
MQLYFFHARTQKQIENKMVPERMDSRLIQENEKKN